MMTYTPNHDEEYLLCLAQCLLEPPYTPHTTVMMANSMSTYFALSSASLSRLRTLCPLTAAWITTAAASWRRASASAASCTHTTAGCVA